MAKQRGRLSGDGYCIQILSINDKAQENLTQKSLYIENISKGGFRFVTDLQLGIEDRLLVLLRFPDDRSKEIFGRVCYRDEMNDSDNIAYGFSVLDGFYSLSAIS